MLVRLSRLLKGRITIWMSPSRKTALGLINVMGDLATLNVNARLKDIKVQINQLYWCIMPVMINARVYRSACQPNLRLTIWAYLTAAHDKWLHSRLPKSRIFKQTGSECHVTCGREARRSRGFSQDGTRRNKIKLNPRLSRVYVRGQDPKT